MEEFHGYDNFPQHIQNYTTEQCQITSGDNIESESEEIPQLEEDWDNSQFADADSNLINRHNTILKVRELEGNTPNTCLMDITPSTRPSRHSVLVHTWKRKTCSSTWT